MSSTQAMPDTPDLRELLGRMTLREKAGQLNVLAGAMDATGAHLTKNLLEKIEAGECGVVFNVYTPEATRELQEVAMQGRLKIPLLFGYDVIHGQRTSFPIPLGLACSWNPKLIRCCARAAARESAADGLHWVFSPMTDLTRDARWGRVAEGAGEDPWLASKIAAAMVQGYQGLGGGQSVTACVKHVALYGAVTAGRDYHAVDMSRREMVETHFPAYEAAVKAGVKTAMTAFTLIEGIPAAGNRWLLKDVLCDRWGFQGLVVTDYDAIAELCTHGIASDLRDAARQAFAAGVHLDMMSEAYLNELPALVEEGIVSESDLDAAVLAVLEWKRELGLFDDPFARCRDSSPRMRHLTAVHRKLALAAARESIVLLKNETSLLPLSKRGTIAVIGPMAHRNRDLLGCWRAAASNDDAISILDAIRDIAGDAGVEHAEGCGVAEGPSEALEEAATLAERADVVILVLGESREMSGEAACRVDIRLPKAQRRLAKRIAKTGKPCVLVTLSGRPLELSREAERFSTMVHLFSPGHLGGVALAQTLFGLVAPIGKLPMGFPRHVGQLPMTYREKPSGRPFDAANSYTSKYLDCPNEPLFSFGHGLTYGALNFDAIAVEPTRITAGQRATVRVSVSNPGPLPVTETLQLYLRDCVASVARPVRELRGFQRITVAPGESREVVFSLGDEDLQFPGSDLEPVVEPGEFAVMAGASSEHRLETKFLRI